MVYTPPMLRTYATSYVPSLQSVTWHWVGFDSDEPYTVTLNSSPPTERGAPFPSYDWIVKVATSPGLVRKCRPLPSGRQREAQAILRELTVDETESGDGERLEERRTRPGEVGGEEGPDERREALKDGARRRKGDVPVGEV